MKKIAFFFIAVLLTACSNDIQISSDSTKFMGEELGKPVSNKGELYYDEDKGCFLKTKNGAVAHCLLKTKQVFKISVNCESGKSDASMDDVKCGSSIPSDKQSNSQKLCNESRFDEGYYLKKNNSYFWINNQNKVTELVLVREEKYLMNEGEDPYTRDSCTEIPKERELKVKNIKNEIIEHTVCVNKIIYHERLHVQRLLDQARLSGNQQMKMIARAVCGNDAMAYLYHHDQINSLARKINLSDSDLDLLFKEAKEISFSQVQQFSESKNEIKLHSDVLTEMASQCGIKNIESGELSKVIQKQMRITNGEEAGYTIEQICNREIPGLF